MGRFQRSISLFKSSWSVVKTDRELLLLPIISGFVSLVVMASFAAPAFFSMQETTGTAYGDSGVGAASTLQPTVLTYVIGALFYLVSAFVVIFFNAALICGANERFEGGDPTLGSALRGAWSRVGVIFQWSLISATVSMIIRQIQENGGLLGKIIGGLIGFAWAVVTFLVLPMLVIEGVGVKEAFTRSKDSVRATWGENVVGQGGIGLLGLLLMIPCVMLGVLGVATLSTSVALGIALIVVAVAAMLAGSIVLSAMSVIYQTALYRYAMNRPTVAFDAAALSGAFGAKRGRR